MTYQWIIVDGYSLLYRLQPVRRGPRRVDRHLLIRTLERVCSELAPRVTVVFDGRGEGGADAFYDGPLDVRYSPGHLTADSVIERLVHEHGDPRSVLVVTSDLQERRTVEAMGAGTMSCGDFIEWARREEQRLQSRPRRRHRPPPAVTLGERFPPDFPG